ncbi:MAG: class I SAM-dependent methyltransferase [Promethearchaeota archaeon]
MDFSKTCFDWASSFYDYSRAVPDDLINKISIILKKHIEILSTSKILEVGVGTGRIAIPLSKKLNITTIGVDISYKMLQKCHTKIKSSNSLQLLLADALSLPFSNTQFDVILTCHLLHLLPNIFDFIKNLKPILVRHGYFINLEAYINFHQTIPFVIYYGKLAENGFHHIFRGDIVRRSLIIYLTRKGWSHTQYVVESNRYILMNDLVRFIRERVFSHQRAIADDLHLRSLEYLNMEIERKIIDLSEEVIVPATSRINIFQCPN